MSFSALLPAGYCSCTPLESFPPGCEGQAPLGSYSLSPFAKVLFPRLHPAWILMVSNPCFSRAPLFYSYFSTISVGVHHGLAGFLFATISTVFAYSPSLVHVPHATLLIGIVLALAFVPTNTHPQFVPWGASFLACSVPCAFHTHRCHPSWVPTDRVHSNIWFPSLAPLSHTQLVCRLGFHIVNTYSTVLVSWDLYLANDVPPCVSPTL